MKRFIAGTLIAVCLFGLFGCASPKNINGIRYDTYGILNASDKKNPNISYEVSIGNIIWSALLVETIIVPIYFIGFDLYEPVGVKNAGEIKGAI